MPRPACSPSSTCCSTGSVTCRCASPSPAAASCTARSGWGRPAGRGDDAAGATPEGETAQLVAALRDRDTVPADIAEAVVERSGGNPLYAEEFMRMLRDQTRLDGRPAPRPGYRGPATDDPCVALVPLDALPTGLRITARTQRSWALRAGPVRWRSSLARATTRRAPPSRSSWAARCCAGPRRPRSPARPSTRPATCSCATWRTDASRASNVPTSTGPRHGWLSTALGEGGADREERLASHYTEAHDLARAAGDPMASSMADEAVEHLLAAARRAAGLIRPGPRPRATRSSSWHPTILGGRALMAAGTAALVSGRFDEADEDLHQAVEAFVLHDDEIAADATVMLARSRSSAATSRGRPLLNRAIDVLESIRPGPSSRTRRPAWRATCGSGRPARMHVVVGAGAHARA